MDRRYVRRQRPRPRGPSRLVSALVPAIVELTPLTLRGHDLLDQLESKTGQLPFKIIEESGAKAYYLGGAANVGRFKAAIDRVDPNWEQHLAFRDVTPTE